MLWIWSIWNWWLKFSLKYIILLPHHMHINHICKIQWFDWLIHYQINSIRSCFKKMFHHAQCYPCLSETFCTIIASTTNSRWHLFWAQFSKFRVSLSEAKNWFFGSLFLLNKHFFIVVFYNINTFIWIFFPL